MEDKLFEKLVWTGECWQTSVEVPFFREIGARIHEGAVGVTRGAAGPSEPATIRPNPPILLTIDTGGERRRPAESQLEGWRRLRERGDQVWQDCVRQLRAEYEFQRPARVRWWTATYGAAGVDDVLPELSSDACFTSLIVPVHIRIHEPTGKSAVADVGVKFACTWDAEGCGVLVRDGDVTDVGDPSVAFPNTVAVQEWSVHPILGALRRLQAGGQWVGEVRIEPFLDFACVAGTRAAFARDPAHVRKRSDLDWSFARGEFHVFIHTGPGGYTLDEATAMLADFQHEAGINASAILRAILAHYAQSRDERQRAYRGPDADARFPEVASLDGLRDLIQLIEVNLFADASGRGGVIGLVFVGFDKGVGVRWRNGAVEEVGLPKIGRPQRQR